MAWTTPQWVVRGWELPVFQTLYEPRTRAQAGLSLGLFASKIIVEECSPINKWIHWIIRIPLVVSIHDLNLP